MGSNKRNDQIIKNSKEEVSRGKRWNKVGSMFGFLEVLQKVNGQEYLCKCHNCEKEVIVKSYNLRLNDLSRCQTHCGCLKKEYYVNENFFEKIDTEEKAYILGLIASDGCITRINGVPNSLQFVFKDTNVKILEDINKAMSSNYRIYFYDINYKYKNEVKIKRACRLNIWNKKIINDLEKYGIVPNKSLNLKVKTEKISNELKRHFYRGFYDGDGSFSLIKKTNKNKKGKTFSGSYILFTSLITSNSMSNIVKRDLEEFFPEIDFKIHEKYKGNEKTVEIKSYSIYKNLEFLQWLYNDSNIFLHRKKDKLENILKIYNDFNN